MGETIAVENFSIGELCVSDHWVHLTTLFIGITDWIDEKTLALSSKASIRNYWNRWSVISEQGIVSGSKRRKYWAVISRVSWLWDHSLLSELLHVVLIVLRVDWACPLRLPLSMTEFMHGGVRTYFQGVRMLDINLVILWQSWHNMCILIPWTGYRQSINFHLLGWEVVKQLLVDSLVRPEDVRQLNDEPRFRWEVCERAGM